MTAYKQFITAVGKLLGGDDEMKKRAEEIVAFETKLAKVRTLNYVMTAHSHMCTPLVNNHPKCQA